MEDKKIKPFTFKIDPVNNSTWNEISKQGGLAGFFRRIAERLSRSGSSTMDIENILKKNTQNFLSFN